MQKRVESKLEKYMNVLKLCKKTIQWQRWRHSFHCWIGAVTTAKEVLSANQIVARLVDTITMRSYRKMNSTGSINPFSSASNAGCRTNWLTESRIF